MNSLPLPDPSELIPEHQDLVVDIEAEWELRNSTLRRDPRYVQQSLTSVLNDPRVRARSLVCSRSRARLQAALLRAVGHLALCRTFLNVCARRSCTGCRAYLDVARRIEHTAASSTHAADRAAGPAAIHRHHQPGIERRGSIRLLASHPAIVSRLLTLAIDRCRVLWWQYYHLFQQDRAAETLDEGETAPLAESTPARRVSASSRSRSRQILTRDALEMRNSPLSVIPHVYYREDFSLNNPEVFAIACEPALSSPVMAQEKVHHSLAHSLTLTLVRRY